MGTTMGEIDPHAESIDELLITLACRHVFTVETLDGICELSSYYRSDDQGNWTELAQPPPGPTGLRKPPLCPSCRGPITAKRYGRVFKGADLDISEQNLANSMLRTLKDIQGRIYSLSMEKIKTWVVNAMTKIPDDVMNVQALNSEQSAKIRRNYFKQNTNSPVGIAAFEQIDRVHGLPASLAKAWIPTAKLILTSYKACSTVASCRSAHGASYEAALSTLYRHCMDQFLHGRAPLPTNVVPEDIAMEKAKIQCGSVPPKADKRFAVEAFWTSIEARESLIKVAGLWTEQIKDRYVTKHKGVVECWMDFVIFIQESINHDTLIALKIASESQTHRQVVKSTLLFMQAELDLFIHRLAKEQLSPIGPTRRKELIGAAKTNLANAKMKLAQVSSVFRNATGGHPTQQQWLAQNFTVHMDGIIDEWNTLMDKIHKGGEVTAEEKREVIKALMAAEGYSFATRGHFYRCPNGHIYVIGECGGAMQTSRCPDCGATIGGSSHTLRSDNRSAGDMEAILGSLGAGPSPWPWARGV
ncbi:hypothetical protein FRC03_009762 [Tulasnella sp. 419]|nr:hypothetical protein FRC03_009762 [Tulasnella sp. 419]